MDVYDFKEPNSEGALFYLSEDASGAHRTLVKYPNIVIC